MSFAFSLRETAAIANVPEPVIRKAIETKAIQPRAVPVGRTRAPRYRFDTDDMLLLKLLAEFPFSLEKTDKAALRDLIPGKRKAVGRWEVSGPDFVVRSPSGDVVFIVRAKRARDALARNLAIYSRGETRIVSDPGILSGEPVYKGTRIPLAHVVGLIARGVSRDEIKEDYPTLSAEDLAFAEIFSKMKPRPGRPAKPLELRRPSGGPA